MEEILGKQSGEVMECTSVLPYSSKLLLSCGGSEAGVFEGMCT